MNFEELKIVKRVFDQHRVPFFIAYGTCLGFYRDGDFLPEDDDIDLVVTEPINLRTRKHIGWMLYDLGFKPQDTGFNVFNRLEPAELGYNGTERTGIINCEKNTKFTVFFFYEEDCDKHGKEMVCIAKLGACKLISSPSKFYKKPQPITIKGVEFLMPSPVEEYLDFTYEDWKNPLARDHGKIYFEMHPDKLEIVENILDKQAVYYVPKK